MNYFDIYIYNRNDNFIKYLLNQKKNKIFSIVIVIFHLFICQVIGQGVIGQFNDI